MNVLQSVLTLLGKALVVEMSPVIEMAVTPQEVCMLSSQ